MTKIREEETYRVRDRRNEPLPKAWDPKPEAKKFDTPRNKNLPPGMGPSKEVMDRAERIGRQQGRGRAQRTRAEQSEREYKRKIRAQAYSNDRAQYNRSLNVYKETKNSYGKANVGNQADYDKVLSNRKRNRLMPTNRTREQVIKDLAKSRLRRGD